MTKEEKLSAVFIIVTALAVVLNQVWKGHQMRMLGF